MNNILILGDFNFHFDSNEIHHAKFKKNYAFIILNNHHFYLIILLLNVTLIFNILLLEKLFHTDVLKNNYEEFEWDLTELTLPIDIERPFPISMPFLLHIMLQLSMQAKKAFLINTPLLKLTFSQFIRIHRDSILNLQHLK